MRYPVMVLLGEIINRACMRQYRKKMGGEIGDKQWNTNFEVQVQFLHSLHEGNQCADFLVRTGSSQTSTCELWFHHLPGMDQLLLAADIMGIALLSLLVFVYTIFRTQKEGGGGVPLAEL